MVVRGHGVEISIPHSLGAIPISEYFEFKAARIKFLSQPDMDDTELAAAMLEVLPVLVEGPLERLPLFSNRKEFGIDYEDLCLYDLYFHLTDIIDNYKPTPVGTRYAVDWYDEKGKSCSYYLEPDEAKRMQIGKGYSAGEVIELNEYRRKLLPMEEKDGTGKYELTLACRQLAILLRKEGEVFPWSRTKRKELVEGRTTVFQDFPASAYKDVAFFLTAMTGISVKEKLLSPSSTRIKNPFTGTPINVKRNSRLGRELNVKEGSFGTK